MSICIVGYGYVGQATHKLLKENVDFILDIDTSDETWQICKQHATVVFICVPTPSNPDGSCNTSIVQSVMQKMGTRPLYVIRSTIPWTFEMPGYRMVANPEFLKQVDYLNVNHKQLLGGKYLEMEKVAHLYGTECTMVPWDIAWKVKYASNLYGAFKVCFWEMIHDITGDERYVYQTWKGLDIDQTDMAQVGMDGIRGYSGACFPKDTAAMEAMSHHPLIQAIMQYNKELQDDQQN